MITDSGLKTIWNYYTPKDSVYRKEISTYDFRGNETGWYCYNKSGYLVVSDRYQYDYKERLIVKWGYDTDTNSFHKDTYKYDTFNNIIEECLFKNKVLLGKHSYEYDKLNRLVESFSAYKDSNSNYKITNTYDDNSNLIWGDGYQFSNAKTSIYKYKYDKFGNLINTTTFVNGNKYSIIERTIEYYE
ncbi:MAG: hypothetical protein SGJ10_07790 [Bacteroidota bacterium]|nr:hypothetical protein [Bacteroidota bacterium]